MSFNEVRLRLLHFGGLSFGLWSSEPPDLKRPWNRSYRDFGLLTIRPIVQLDPSYHSGHAPRVYYLTARTYTISCQFSEIQRPKMP